MPHLMALAKLHDLDISFLKGILGKLLQLAPPRLRRDV